MKLTITVALLTCLIALGSAQDFTGGQIDDLYTGRVTVFPTNDEQYQTFTQPLSRQDAFTSLTQEFFIATGKDIFILSPERYWN